MRLPLKEGECTVITGCGLNNGAYGMVAFANPVTGRHSDLMKGSERIEAESPFFLSENGGKRGCDGVLGCGSLRKEMTLKSHFKV